MLKLGIGLSGGATPAFAEGEQDENAKTDASPGLSAIDRFRAQQDYRTEVRQAVLETMLDDRHDLHGNTLYMLKFDASIIPPRGMSREFAVIAIDIKRNSSCASGGDGTQKYSDQRGSTECTDLGAESPEVNGALDEIYGLWIDHIRETVSKEYLNIVMKFLGRKYEEHELLEIWDVLELTPEQVATAEQALREEVDVSLRYLERLQREYQRVSSFQRTYEHTRRICSEPADKQTPAWKDWNEQRNRMPGNPPLFGFFTDTGRSGSDRLSTMTAQLFENLRRRVLVRAARAQASSMADMGSRGKHFDHADQEAIYERWLAGTEALVKAAHGQALLPFPEAEAPSESWSGKIERVFKKGKLGDCKTVKALSEELQRSEGIGLEDFFAESERLYADAREVWGLERFLARQSMGEYFVNELEQRLPGLARFELQCDFDAQLCRILVNESCLGQAKPKGNHDHCPAPPAFIAKLDPENDEFFTYAATPKESARAGLTATVDRTSAVGNASAAMPTNDQMGTSVAGGYATGARSLVAERMVQVMGFSGIGSDNKWPRFGWMIQPRGVDKELQPLQKSLTAIVAVPSWWKEVVLEVRTCWRGAGGFTRQELESNRPCENEPVWDSRFTIDLPSNIKDINRRLGYDIRRVPFIETLNGDFGLSFPEYHVGQKNARLLIEGGDLWRSTMVTLGSQRADEILVLPNMRGIIATFKQIGEPSRPEPCQTFVPIRVWTSEGVTMEDSANAKIWRTEDGFKNGRCSSSGKPPGTDGKDAAQEGTVRNAGAKDGTDQKLPAAPAPAPEGPDRADSREGPTNEPNAIEAPPAPG
jgi:hypothetical protein